MPYQIYVVPDAHGKMCAFETPDRPGETFEEFSERMDYLEGAKPPNYSLPALLGPVFIDMGMVYIYHVDPQARIAPIITWWNESWGLPIPSDHGVSDYSKDFVNDDYT